MDKEEIKTVPLSKIEDIKQRVKVDLDITKSDIEKRDQEGKFKRQQWFADSIAWVRVLLIRFFGVMVVVFVLLVFGIGLIGSQSILPNTPGVIAIEKLFEELIFNAKTVILIVLGFFFRDYIAKITD